MIKAVLFDFDGVLTIDGTGSESICKYICEKTGVDLERFKDEYYKYNDDLLYGKIQHKDMWDKLCKALKGNQEKNLVVPKSMGINVIYFNHTERDYENLIQEFNKLSMNVQ